MKKLFLILIIVVVLAGCTEQEVKKSQQNINNEPVVENIKEELKFGLAENQRKKVFNEVLEAEREAQGKADLLYPMLTVEQVNKNLDDNVDYFREIQAEEKEKIYIKHNITDDNLWDIITEGIENKW